MTYGIYAELSPEASKRLVNILRARFEANMERHERIKSASEWDSIQAKLEADPKKMWSLNEMERTGGEPDVAAYDFKAFEYTFFDFSVESPAGRRDIVYDKAAEDWLKENRPHEQCNGNAVDMAGAMGIEMLDPTEYAEVLQKKGKFDLNSSSWIKTPENIRKTGDALDGQNYGNLDISETRAYHHSIHEGFRGALKV